jgi:hypothetical protein
MLRGVDVHSNAVKVTKCTKGRKVVNYKYF